MDSALTIGLSSSLFHLKPNPSLIPPTTCKPILNLLPPPSILHFPISKPSKPSPPRPNIRIKASSNNPTTTSNPIIHNLKITARTIIFTATAASMIGKFQQYPAIAETPQTLTEEIQEKSEEDLSSTPLSEFIESNSEAVNALKILLQEKLEAGDDEESLNILKKLVLAQPGNSEWKFLMGRLLNEMGQTQEARNVFEEILAKDPLSYEALFEMALIMDRCGEGNAVIERLEQALKIAVEEEKVKEARDVKFIMAQVQFLQKDVEMALSSYDELVKEDPNDFRPYFCKGMIYSLLNKNMEAREHFAKYRELSPKKFEVEGYLRTPLSKMKLFGTDEDN